MPIALRITRFVNLILAELLAGNEFGIWMTVHQSLWTMSIPEHIRAEQSVQAPLQVDHAILDVVCGSFVPSDAGTCPRFFYLPFHSHRYALLYRDDSLDLTRKHADQR